MKATLLSMSLLVLGSVPVQGQEGPREIRVVNNVAVDITPVVEWFKNPGTNGRPMAHWKAIKAQSIRKQVAGWDLCSVVTESGSTVEILVANLPASVKGPLQQAAQVDAQIAAVSAGADQSAAVAGGAGAALGNGPRARAMRAQAGSQAGAMRGQVEELKRQRKLMSGAVTTAQGTRVLAMNTGRKYAGYEVWDCGKVPAGVGRGL